MSLGRDALAGLILLAISLALLVQSFSLPSLPIVPVGPGFFPRIVLGFLAAASVVLIFQDWSKQKQRALAVASAGDAAPRRNYPLVAAVFAVVAGYIVLLPLLGFRVATALFVATLQATLDWPKTTRQWVVLIVIAAGTAAVTYLLFETYLLVLLPRGSWTGW